MANDAIIRELIDRVRRRWRTLRALQVSARVALAVLAVLVVWLVASRWTAGAPYRLAALAFLAVAAIAVVVIRGFWPLRRAPDDRHVARFIEEREPSLDDRLASAVDAADRSGTTAGFVDAMRAGRPIVCAAPGFRRSARRSWCSACCSRPGMSRASRSTRRRSCCFRRA